MIAEPAVLAATALEPPFLSAPGEGANSGFFGGCALALASDAGVLVREFSTLFWPPALASNFLEIVSTVLIVMATLLLLIARNSCRLTDICSRDPARNARLSDRATTPLRSALVTLEVTPGILGALGKRLLVEE